MRIGIQNSQELVPIRRQKVRQVAQKTLKHFNIGNDTCLNILFIDDFHMSALHERFLGKKGPTDVLAFGMQEGRPLKGDTALLGDIAISTQTALRYAKRFRSTAEREILLYVIHGILHLLGYDDHGKSARVKMRRKEQELLRTCQSGD